MSLRLKLLLLGLLTLVLPWAGCQYAREMEGVLRAGERQSLAAEASTLAASLQGRTDLLYRSDAPDAAAPAGPNDIAAVLLTSAPMLDGYVDEWPAAGARARTFTHPPDSFQLRAGVHDRMLYLLVDVHDRRVVFDAPQTSPLDPGVAGDRVWIGFEDSDGIETQVFIATTSAGPVRARRIEEGDLGRKLAVDEPRIEGVWQATPGGYRVALRIPLSMLGGRLGVLVDDRETRGGTPVSYGSLAPEDLATQGRLIVASPDLAAYLARFRRAGLRIAVEDTTRNTLGASDALSEPGPNGPPRGILGMAYRRVLRHEPEGGTLAAEAPIFDRTHARAIGMVRTSERSDLWISLRDDAVARLMNLTLGVSAFAVLAMGIFAARLAWRLSRLRRASETALGADGLDVHIPETDAPDELGDIARSYSTLLGRIQEYTSYLRTLAGKLAHEIRTPLAIVRSSIENLESEGGGPETLSASSAAYLARAREGADRLNAILVAMSAATRVEEAIASAERECFDVAALLRTAVEGYRLAFATHRFATDLPPAPVMLDGAPDLLVQLLDKLVENAVDFSPVDATITVRLTSEPDQVRIDVDNPGPSIPPEWRARLFESLWQSRPPRQPGGEADPRPHFGLGLYVVRLIAEFHGGTVEASDLPGGPGARLSVRLPRRGTPAASSLSQQ